MNKYIFYEKLEKELIGYKELLEDSLKTVESSKKLLNIIENLVSNLELIENDLKQHIIFSLLGDKKHIYMNMVNMCFNYGTFVSLLFFYAYNPLGISTLLQSVGILDFLAKIAGFGGTLLYGTASFYWLKNRIREYKLRRKSFEKNFNLYDERIYFPWEKENSKIKKFLDIFR